MEKIKFLVNCHCHRRHFSELLIDQRNQQPAPYLFHNGLLALLLRVTLTCFLLSFLCLDSRIPRFKFQWGESCSWDISLNYCLFVVLLHFTVLLDQAYSVEFFRETVEEVDNFL